jgi:hydrogenase nickel incorporation protein HypA/HybF
MHELSIAISLIELAEQEAAKIGGTVVALHVRIGALSGVVKDALLFSYQVASADTALAGTRLVIEDGPVTVYCATCQREGQLASAQLFVCPLCGGLTPDVRQGKELQLTALEMAT